MKLEYRSVSTGDALDTITVEGTRISYDTGAARDLFEARIELLGFNSAIRSLRDWSNGYVSMHELR